MTPVMTRLGLLPQTIHVAMHVVKCGPHLDHHAFNTSEGVVKVVVEPKAGGHKISSRMIGLELLASKIPSVSWIRSRNRT